MQIFEHCKSCEHTKDECDKCYPELGYKNTKMERDSETVKKFVNSDIFQELVNQTNEGSDNH